jgi:uncharacterized protein YjbI with pentapeptide repeats
MPDTDRFEGPPPWRTCTETDCQGKQLSSADGRCFAHASNDERAEALAMLSAGAPLDFAAGVHFTDDRLVELLAALPRDAAEHWILQQADFRDATLPSVDLQGASFKGDAVFDGANFQGDAEFDGANF